MTPGIRAIVVDDEPLARRGICARLRRAGGIEVVRQCGGGREAIKAIRELEPDLVFLDVQMPVVDGFAVTAAIGADAMPPVVFVTAYDEHALRAFDAQALDYLLKPIDDERFDRALVRARRRVAERRESAVGRQVSTILRGAARDEEPNDTVREGRILIRERGRVNFIDARDVDWIEATGDYARLHVAGRRHLLRQTMSSLERALDPLLFTRIHRSTIVNASRIGELRFRSARDWTVVLRDGTQLRLSRRYRPLLERRLRGVV
jgi:two-component system, LytTR family, response regulator